MLECGQTQCINENRIAGTLFSLVTRRLSMEQCCVHEPGPSPNESHQVARQCVSSDLFHFHIHERTFERRPIAVKEADLVLSCPPKGLVSVLGINALNKNLHQNMLTV